MSYKIDWTTLGNVPIGGTNGVPIANTTMTITTQNVELIFTRVGNFVKVDSFLGTESSFSAVNPRTTIVGTIPEGYRPIPEQSTYLVASSCYRGSSGSSASYVVVLRNNGEVAFGTNGWSGAQWLYGGTTYITGDSFPS